MDVTHTKKGYEMNVRTIVMLYHIIKSVYALKL
jgi:hypothetical protein